MVGINETWQKWWQERGPISWRWAKFYPFALLRAYTKERLPSEAQAMVYVTLLTLVPLLAVAFSLLRGFGVNGVIEPWLRNMFEPMGDAGSEVVDRLIQFVSQTSAGGLGIVGVAVLFISVINLAQKIETTLNRIWRVENERALKARISGYVSAVLLAPLLIGAIMSTMLGMKDAAWLQPYLHLPGVGTLFSLLTGLLPMVIVFLIMASSYAWIPNRSVSLKAAFTGAAFFLLLWYPVSWLFSRFIAGSANYSVIYSSFASMIILLLWLYFLWLLFIMGAKVASLIDLPDALSPYDEHEWYADEQMALGIAVMTEIDHRFAHAEEAPNIEELSKKLHSSPQKVSFLLDRLHQGKLIRATDDSPARYMLSKARSLYTLRDIYQVLAMPKDTVNLNRGAFAELERNMIAQMDIPLMQWQETTKNS
ncbi:YihY/virulence factor BrkB family protein [Suttonella sp. R2A3]|uniref:YihY/virulence factor BrkB family protein n=1 Tax=Suttonella sp. R2A3 TaxID=2908648 RepID=UPI001F30B311|nr:YihY/virulence factor BrkB family protein [Suttonella sp. R2A3]UJF24007.1 YihY/virulence factor BrkB family protein [Suttonella sp. R2A3]